MNRTGFNNYNSIPIIFNNLTIKLYTVMIIIVQTKLMLTNSNKQ